MRVFSLKVDFLKEKVFARPLDADPLVYYWCLAPWLLMQVRQKKI